MVRDSNRRRGLINVLSTRTTGCDVSLDRVVVFGQINFDLFRLGQYRDRSSRGMNPALGFGIRNTLHTVTTAFVLQFPVTTFAFDGHRNVFEPTQLGWV